LSGFPLNTPSSKTMYWFLLFLGVFEEDYFSPLPH